MRDSNPLARIPAFVTEHSTLIIVVMLLATVAVGSGITAISDGDQGELAADSSAANASEYVRANYDVGAENRTVVSVYVRDTDGNVLSKPSLLASLRYQQRALDNETVAGKLADRRGVVGVSNLVARRLTDGEAATLAAQTDALAAAESAEGRRAVEQVLADDTTASRLLPASSEPGTATAESRRIAFRFESDGTAARRGAVPVAQAALSDAAAVAEADAETDASAEYFMLSGPAMSDVQSKLIGDTLELVGPVALVFVLFVLAVAYRDLVDVLVGFAGVVLTLVWMLGLVGWLGVPFTQASIVAPILIVGLSIDYGIHVFMRYREQRGADGEADEIRPAMRAAVRSVGTALVLVTLTTAIGFLSNLTNSLSTIRSLALATSLGIVAALVVFVTLVPALKVEIDDFLEGRLGRDRTREAFGVGGRTSRLLSLGTRAARRAPRAIIVFALLTSAVGAYSVTTLDSKPYTPIEEPAEWKQDLPEPLGAQDYPYAEHSSYVRDTYRSSSDQLPVQVLVRGDVTDPAVLHGVGEATDRLRNAEIAYRRADGSVPVRTPLTVLHATAATDPDLRATLDRADTDDDGVPESNVTAVYDALFAAAPDTAGQVIERTGGAYESVRVVVPMRGSAGYDDQTAVATDAAALAERAGEGEGDTAETSVTATATGEAVVAQAEVREIRNNIFVTLAVALAAVGLLLAVVFRLMHDSATLGAVTGLAVVFVLTYVFGAMALLGVPLTLFTALMVSLAVGLGIDYSIHVTHRYVEELADHSPGAALHRTVTGTGGALLGSTATTVGAFGSLSLATFTQFRNMGILVALSLVLSLVTALVVIPAFLVVWTRWTDPQSADQPAGTPVTTD